MTFAFFTPFTPNANDVYKHHDPVPVPVFSSAVASRTDKIINKYHNSFE